MRHRTASGWSIEAGLVLALFLAVQAFFSGLSLGAAADTLDPVRTVLCTGSSSSRSDPSPATPDRAHPADCCTLGCPMVGAAAAPEPASVPLRFAVGIDASAVKPHRDHHPGRAELSPLRSRAPPIA